MLFSNLVVAAQVIKGVVINEETKDAIANIEVLNKRSGVVAYSDSDGNYAMQVMAGDTLSFRNYAYYDRLEIMPSPLRSRYLSTLMQPLVHKLKEATIIGLTKYQRDSIEMQSTFGHELNRPLVPKPKYTGLGCAGCIGWLADKITGNSKKPKRFRHDFASEDEEKYIDSRYTPKLVALLTGMSDTDSIATFMYKYPMDYSFARSATDLELKGWIRDSYKQYLSGIKKKDQ